MSNDLSLKETQKEWHGTLKAYVIGFVVSILLTAASFGLVITRVVSGRTLIFSIVGLALAQAIVQLIFFLHVGQDEKPRWDMIVFYFMVLVLLLVAVGTLWIMHTLNDRLMSM